MRLDTGSMEVKPNLQQKQVIVIKSGNSISDVLHFHTLDVFPIVILVLYFFSTCSYIIYIKLVLSVSLFIDIPTDSLCSEEPMISSRNA